MLVWIYTSAQMASTKNRLLVARIFDAIDINYTFTKAQPILWSECTLIDIANRDSFFVAAYLSCTGNASEAHKLCLNDMAVVIYAEDVFCRIPAIISFAHLCSHFFTKCWDAMVPNTCNTCMTLAKCTVSFVAEQGWELCLFLFCFRMVLSKAACIEAQHRRLRTLVCRASCVSTIWVSSVRSRECFCCRLILWLIILFLCVFFTSIWCLNRRDVLNIIVLLTNAICYLTWLCCRIHVTTSWKCEWLTWFERWTFIKGTLNLRTTIFHQLRFIHFSICV